MQITPLNFNSIYMPVFSAKKKSINQPAMEKPDTFTKSNYNERDIVNILLEKCDVKDKKKIKNEISKWRSVRNVSYKDIDKVGKRMQVYSDVAKYCKSNQIKLNLDSLLYSPENYFNEDAKKLVKDRLKIFNKDDRAKTDYNRCIMLMDTPDEYFELCKLKGRRNFNSLTDSHFIFCRLKMVKDELNKIQNKSIKKSLENLCEVMEKRYFENPQMHFYCIDKNIENIVSVIDTVNDEYIFKLIDKTKKVYSEQNDSENKADFLYKEIKDFCDVVNEGNGTYTKYSRVSNFETGNPSSELAKEQNIPFEFYQKLTSIKRSQNVNIKTARKMLLKELQENKTEFAKSLNRDVKTRYLEDFVKGYNESDSETCKYLYEKYYLNNLTPKTADECRQVAEKFNTYIFLSEDDDIYYAKYIKSELNEWDKASKGKAIFPSYIKITNTAGIDTKYAAFAQGNEYVVINNKKYVGYALRHELMHINDTLSEDGTVEYKRLSQRLENQDKAVINGINLRNKLGQYSSKKWYREEFKNAEIAPHLIDYAYKNKLEYIAVAAEGDYKKYSKEFKDVLSNLGLHKWVYEMKSKSDIDKLLGE